jgi:ferric iron reductase protein FhuF
MERRWPNALAEQLDALGRWFEGRLVLEPDPSAEVVPAERFFDVNYLRSAVARTGDGAIAVSRFSRHYASSLSAIALVALAQGVGLDLSPANCRLVIWHDLPFLTVLAVDEAAVLRCDERPTSWPVGGRSVETLTELRDHVWARLYGDHIAPLFERLWEVTKGSRSLMWSNAAEWVGLVSDAAEEYLGAEVAPPFVADRIALLSEHKLPGVEGPNPLLDRLDWVPTGSSEFPQEVQTRRMCCGTYLIEDRDGRLCQSCPFLPPKDRAALVRERHGVSMGQPGGQAEQVSIDRGRARLPTTPRS